MTSPRMVVCQSSLTCGGTYRQSTNTSSELETRQRCSSMKDVDFPGIDGFLGTRASLMLDVLVLGMLAVVAVLCWSVYQVKFRRRYLLHKRTQLVLGAVVLVVVV